METTEYPRRAFCSSDEEELMETQDTTNGLTAEDANGKTVSAIEKDATRSDMFQHHDLAEKSVEIPSDNVALQQSVKHVAEACRTLNAVYLDFYRKDSVNQTTTLVLLPGGTVLMASELEELCILGNIRSDSTTDALSDLLVFHFDRVDFHQSLPADEMVPAAAIAQQLLRCYKADARTFSSLPFGIRALTRVDHKPAKDEFATKAVQVSYFNNTKIVDSSSNDLQARNMKQLRWHRSSSKYDWMCFVSLDHTEYVSNFLSEIVPRCFEVVMAAALELFEIALERYQVYLHHRQDQATRFKMDIVRGKYMKEVEWNSCPMENMAEVIQALMERVARRASNSKSLCSIDQGKETGTPCRFELALKTNSMQEQDVRESVHEASPGETFRPLAMLSANVADTNVQPQCAEQAVKDSEASVPVVDRDKLNYEHGGSGTRSAKGRKTQKNKAHRKNNDVAASNKGKSATTSRGLLNLHPENTPITLPQATSSQAFQTIKHNLDNHKASRSAEKLDMETVRNRLSKANLHDGELSLDRAKSSADYESGDDGTGWQTVAHGKKRQSADSDVLTRTTPQKHTPRRSTDDYPISTEAAVDAMDEREFPPLLNTTPGQAIAEKVHARKKTKKRKQKAKISQTQKESGDPPQRAALVTSSSQQYESGESSRQGALATSSNSEQASEGQPEQLTTDVSHKKPTENTSSTESDITPKASVINLAIVTQPGNASSPAPASTTTPTPISGPDERQPYTVKFDTFDWVCMKPGCDKVTSPWDGETVICPSCGPYGAIRYCSMEHMLQETTDHWTFECLRHTINQPCDSATIHPRQIQGAPTIPNLCGWNSPERQRQAIFHACGEAIEGDYFIFTDAVDHLQAGSPSDQTWNLRRGKGDLDLIVTFERNREQPENCLKDRFNRFINAALFTSASNPQLLSHLFLMIRENLVSRDLWDDKVLYSVSYQFLKEFAWQVPEYLTSSKRHACPEMWQGNPVDACTSATCNSELLHPRTGVPWLIGYSLKRKLEELERRYWILRVARIYHPTVTSKLSRMKGVGTPYVRPEHQKVFDMGRGWDGYPAPGMMLIERAYWKRTPSGVPALESIDVQLGSITV